MVWNIISVVGILAGTIIAILAYFKYPVYIIPGFENQEWLIPIILIVVSGLVQIPRIFKKNLTDKDKDDIAEKTTAKLKEAFGDTFFDGIANNPKIRTQLEKGAEEMERAKRFEEAKARGEAEAGKQQYEATLNAIDYFNQALSCDIKTSERIALLNLIGLANWRIGNLDPALIVWGEMLELAQELTKSGEKMEALEGWEGLAAAWGNMGLVYQTRGDLDKALEYYNKALKIDQELGRKEGLAIQYGNMGNVYQTRSDLDKALEMYNQALEIAIEMGNKERMAIQYGNMGLVYQIRGDLDKALKYYNKAL
jgi:tetratricopeptide (TPR) repeat protein